MNGALINGLEARVSDLEDKLEDIDARTSEEADNALNEREMDRFIMSGIVLLVLGCNSHIVLGGRTFSARGFKTGYPMSGSLGT